MEKNADSAIVIAGMAATERFANTLDLRLKWDGTWFWATHAHTRKELRKHALAMPNGDFGSSRPIGPLPESWHRLANLEHTSTTAELCTTLR